MILTALPALALALLAPPQSPAVPVGPGPDTSPVPPAPAARNSFSASAGVFPDTVTVGDHFLVQVRVLAPPGATVGFPRFSLIEPVEAADTLLVAQDSTGAWTATYRLRAWTTSDSLVGVFPFRTRAADGAVRDMRVRVRLPHVRSVLPADPELHRPRPARAVIPLASSAPTPTGWLLPALLLLAVITGLLWMWLRTRRSRVTTSRDPRVTALAELDRIEAAGLPERGAVKEYYVRTSRVLREYLAASGGWGEYLTTTEVLASADARREEGELARELGFLLRQADRVKFSGLEGEADARAFGSAVRSWIRAWPPSHASSSSRAEAA